MARKIIWTLKAKNELIEIFQYWNERNQSTNFSQKLNELINNQLNSISQFPKSGKKTNLEKVYLKIIHQYHLFYQIKEESIYILTIRHTKRNPKTITFK
ncbi:MAG: type II toxin-antitoxin system RelE/ParE family toxin [Cytophagaceae bacterium]|nr:type II toxin-antitoxin system RelE/ParE family toxin [Cytophagaceae bacterium]